MTTQRVIQGIGFAIGLAAAAWVGAVTFQNCSAPAQRVVQVDADAVSRVPTCPADGAACTAGPDPMPRMLPTLDAGAGD